ncbi:LysR family transcriptional regulator [Chitinivorax sp. B]|uniref:LysR family transcriptional regulator n=1 Tax=Chitinivorax sp. B TaxID=2502235 RepID=UPI0010F8E2FD|nr:LysR family transcriptional regulator [Chitinivorax sp. B]
MNKIARMNIFATVVDKGSMAGAANELGMSASAISQQIRKLEDSMQLSLLHRNTRKMTLTEAGARYYESCRQVMKAVEEADLLLEELRHVPVGELRIAAPIGFSGHLIADALAPLLDAYPKLRLRLFFHDEVIDLLESRIDLAIRIGELNDSSLVARYITDWNMALCAAPSYLARHPPIQSPEQLSQHDWVALDHDRQPLQLTLSHEDGRQATVMASARLCSNSMLSLRQFVMSGLGLSLQPAKEIRQELESGALVHLLPAWQIPPMRLYVMTHRREGLPAKVNYAIEAIRDRLSAI